MRVAQLLSNHLADFAGADQAQDVVAGVARVRGSVRVGKEEGLFGVLLGGCEVGDKGGAGGPGEVTECGDDHGDGEVGDGFGGCETAVAVDDAWRKMGVSISVESLTCSPAVS